MKEKDKDRLERRTWYIKNHLINFFKLSKLYPYEREMLRSMYRENLFGLTGVEIGVMGGINAFFMLNVLEVKKLYLIDPYPKGYLDGNKSFVDFSKYEEIMKKRLAPFWDRCVFIRKYSDEAVNDVEDDVDFVYIDGNHCYDFVTRDINNYVKKIKKGGIIGGHDWNWKEVARAVIDFSKQNGYYDNLQVGYMDWFIQL